MKASVYCLRTSMYSLKNASTSSNRHGLLPTAYCLLSTVYSSIVRELFTQHGGLCCVLRAGLAVISKHVAIA